MTEPDDRDFAAAFDHLRAPRSTASYRDRARDLRPPTRSRWPQAGAAVLAVVVALGAAATVVGLRTARQNGVATTPAVGPAARTGAAMAYDTTSGLTVMYGGFGADGRPLTDTWEWDGAVWRPLSGAGTGPSVTSPHLVDDPADGGVLLLGMVAPAAGAPVCAGSGSAGGGSAGSSGTATTVEPPAVASAPAAVSPASPPAIGVPPLPSCPPAIALSATEQTWTLGASGWRQRQQANALSVVPSGIAQLALDPASNTVVAVQAGFLTFCGPGLKAPQMEGPCPLAAGSGTSGAATGAPAPACVTGSSCPPICPAVPTNIAGRGGCAGEGVATFTWSGGQWQRVSGAGPQAYVAGVTLVGDPVARRLYLLTSASPAILCGAATSCGAPSVQAATWQWSGTAWGQAAGVPAPPAAALGAVAAPSEDGPVLYATDGQVLSLRNGTWAARPAAGGPGGRFGVALARSPGGGVVLFGGTLSAAVATSGGVTASLPGMAPGADTWTLSSAGWTHAGGTPPPPPPPPATGSACPGPAAGTVCIAPEPVTVPPATPSATLPPTSSPTTGGPPTAP